MLLNDSIDSLAYKKAFSTAQSLVVEVLYCLLLRLYCVASVVKLYDAPPHNKVPDMFTRCGDSKI